jgi:hypothetical protein
MHVSPSDAGRARPPRRVRASSSFRSLARALACSLVALTGSCVEGGSLVPDTPLQLSLTPAEVTCTPGRTVTVQATVTGSEATPRVTFTAADARTAVTGQGTTAQLRCGARGSSSVVARAVDGRRRATVTLPVTVRARPISVTLFATPKILADFDDPRRGVTEFLRNYESLTARAAEVIVIFAVGNSEHILMYPGPKRWDDSVMWARYTNGKDVAAFDRGLTYRQIANVVKTFREVGAASHLTLKVFDQIDPGPEMAWEYWKYSRHPECMDLRWDSFDIRGRLTRDSLSYASAPNGTPAGKQCGEFIVDQSAEYLRDLGFDGILYGNQFGTRGKWEPKRGPGYTAAEAEAIQAFLSYSKRKFGERQIMWFDSYNNVDVERETFSFPYSGYRSFDYLMASGFCVITNTTRYVENLESKLKIPTGPRILATLDYVDPWYTYASMRDFAAESRRLEAIAVQYRDRIDGLVLFANDHQGGPVPRRIVDAFAARFYGD